MIKPLKKDLIGKSVVSKQGNNIGEISDSILNEKTGKLEYIKIKTNTGITNFDDHKLPHIEYTLPASYFTPVKDIVIIEEKSSDEKSDK